MGQRCPTGTANVLGTLLFRVGHRGAPPGQASLSTRSSRHGVRTKCHPTWGRAGDGVRVQREPATPGTDPHGVPAHRFGCGARELAGCLLSVLIYGDRVCGCGRRERCDGCVHGNDVGTHGGRSPKGKAGQGKTPLRYVGWKNFLVRACSSAGAHELGAERPWREVGEGPSTTQKRRADRHRGSRRGQWLWSGSRRSGVSGLRSCVA